MDKPPPKKKRLIERNSDSDNEDLELDFPSTLSSDKGERKVSFAPSSETPTAETSQTPAANASQNSTTNTSQTPTASATQSSEETDANNNKKKQPRLVMKKMVLNNFKSYAGRQVIGPFHKV
jgi:structural maintenance of chromosome 4